MALRWDLSKITDWKEVCFFTADNGERRMHPLTEMLITSTAVVQMGAITEKNAGEFFRRIALMEAITGSFLHHGAMGTPRPITSADVEQHIGLTTNVTTKSLAAFLRGAWDGFRPLDVERQPGHAYLYRVRDVDNDGDPLDHGFLFAESEEQAVRFVAERMRTLGLSEPSYQVRLYPLRLPIKVGLATAVGFFRDITVKLSEMEAPCTS